MRGRIARLGRASVIFGAGLSFLLLLAVLYLWVRSCFIAEVVYFKPVAAPEEFASPMPYKPQQRWHYQWNLASGAGKVQIVRRNLGVREEETPRVYHLRTDDNRVFTDLKAMDPLDVDWRLGGVQYFHGDRRYVNKPPVQAWVWGFLIVTVPYWLLAVLTAILPMVAGVGMFRSVRRRRRKQAGRCATCGYDLRASGEVCPECGAKVETIEAGPRL